MTAPPTRPVVLTPEMVLAELIACAGRPDREMTGHDVAAYVLDDLGYDSLAVIETAARLEDHYGIRIAEEDLGDCRTIGDVVSRANG